MAIVKGLFDEPNQQDSVNTTNQGVVKGLFDEQPKSNVVENLFEGAKTFGKGVVKGVETMPIAAGGLIQEAGERAEEGVGFQDIAMHLANPAGTIAKAVKSNIFKLTDIDEKIANYGKNIIKKTQAKISAKYPLQKDKVNRVLEDLGAGATSLATSLAIGLGTKNPASAATVFGLMQKGNIYSEARNAGKDPRMAGEISTLAGGVEGALENIGVGMIMKGFGKNIRNRFIKGASNWIGGAITEGLQEGAQTIGESAVAKLGDIREEKLLDVASNAAYSAFLGAVLGGTASLALDTLRNDGTKDALIDGGLNEIQAESVMKNAVDDANKAASDIASQIEQQSDIMTGDDLATSQPIEIQSQKTTIPNMENSQQAIQYGESIKDKPEIIAQLKEDYARSVEENRALIESDPNEAMKAITKAQLLREAYESAEDTINPEIKKMVLDRGEGKEILEPKVKSFRNTLSKKLTPEKADATMKLVEGMAKYWGKSTGEYLKDIDVKEGGDVAPDAYTQDGKLVTDNPNFQSWFADSKVVDKGGAPLVVYHGSSATFEEFDFEKIGQLGSSEGYGFYFTDDKNTALGYKDTRKDTSKLYEAYVSIKNPLRVDTPPMSFDQTEEVIQKIAEAEMKSDPEGIEDIYDTSILSSGLSIDMSIEGNDTLIDQIAELANVSGSKEMALKALYEVTGYDGVISDGYKGEGKAGGNIYIPFSPNQIKSVDNKGSFSTKTDNIYYQTDESTMEFTSSLVDTVKNLKQSKGSPDQMLNLISKQAGVKSEEIEWTGLKEWLGDKKSVTKEEISDFLENNQVKVETVEKGSYSPEVKKLLEELTAKNKGRVFDDWAESDQDLWMEKRGEPQETKFSQYTLPGGENYREVLVTLPARKQTLTFKEYLKNYRERFPQSDLPDFEIELYYEKGVVVPSEAGRGFVEQVQKERKDTYKSSHFEEPNILTHLRLNDRTDADGNKVLFIEEIQSDWHQAGRKRGYKKDISKEEIEVKFFPPKVPEGHDPSVYPGHWESYIKETGERITSHPGAWDESRVLEDAVQAYDASFKAQQVPNAPFKKTWQDLAFKKALQIGVSEGYDKIAWTPGEVQAERYDLSTKIDSVSYKKDYESGLYDVSVVKDEKEVLSKEGLNESEVSDLLGKDLSQKMVDREGKEERIDSDTVYTLSGLDLKVGGEGMKGFYDKILPKAVQKIVGKLDKGVKVGTTTITEKDAFVGELEDQEPGTKPQDVNLETWSIDLTSKLKSEVEKGLPLFQKKGNVKRGAVTLGETNIIQLFEKSDASTIPHELAHIFLNQLSTAKGAKFEADYRVIKRWLKIKGDKISVKQQESFAKGFEKYLMTEEAPTPKMQKIFEDFRRWLTEIYGGINDYFKNTKYDSKVKEVFDKMIGIEEDSQMQTADTAPLDSFNIVKDLWFGEKDWRQIGIKNEVIKLQDSIKENLGKTKYDVDAKNLDRALQIYIDLKRNPDHLAKYYDSLTDDQKIIVDISQNLTDEQKLIAERISNSYKAIGIEAFDADIIRNVLDNYAGRVWDMEDKKPSTQTFRKFGTTTRHAKQRVFDTILEGWANGKNLKVEGATNNLGILKDEIVKTIEDKKLVNKLKKLKTIDGDAVLSTNQLKDYKKVEHANFKTWEVAGDIDPAQTYGKNFFVTEDGKVMERKDLYAPKEIADNMNNILGVSKLKGIATIDAITKYNTIIKSWVLQSSFFHHLAFMRSYYLGTHGKKLSEMNPSAAYKSGLDNIKNEAPIIELGVRNGLTLGLMQDWDENLLKEETVLSKIMDKNKATKKVKEMVSDFREGQADFLFNKLGAGLKAKAFEVEMRNIVKKYPNQNIDKLAKNVAELINNDFGGLHLKRMGRNPTIQHIFRIVALAPDWTESNIRTMIKAMGKGKGALSEDQIELNLNRKFWSSIITKGLVATQLANMLMAAVDEDDDKTKGMIARYLRNFQTAWNQGKFRWLDVDITPIYKATGGDKERRKYFSILGHFKDPLKFLLRNAKDGKFGIGNLRAFKHKASIIGGAFLDLITGTDYAGRRFTTMKEFLGMDKEKGVYKTNRKGKYKRGDPKWGKLKGKTVVFDYGKRGMVESEQMPSFALNRLRHSTPVQVQNLMSLMTGEMEAFDALANSMGLGVSTTYEKK